MVHLVARVLQLGAVSRIGFVGGTGTSRVRLGNVPNMCEVNPGRQDSSGTGLVREGDVPETFPQKIDVSICFFCVIRSVKN